MITKVLFVILAAMFTGCAFVQEATRYHPSDYVAPQYQDPCAGVAEYYQCRNAYEQARANDMQQRRDRVNAFWQGYNSMQQPVRQPAPSYQPVQTNCHSDAYGNTNCTSY